MKKKLLKSEQLRIKNDKLHAQGKYPVKGWGKMVNTGFSGGGGGLAGGLNGNNIAFDNMGATIQEKKIKEISKNHEQ